MHSKPYQAYPYPSLAPFRVRNVTQSSHIFPQPILTTSTTPHFLTGAGGVTGYLKPVKENPQEKFDGKENE